MTSVSGEQQRREFQSLLHQFVERKIELRPYEIYEQRGRSDGQAFDDWLRAEAEVLRGSVLSPWRERAQFLAMAAQMMPRILVTAARACGAQKRGGGGSPKVKTAVLSAAPDPSILAVDEVLPRSRSRLTPGQGC